MALQVWLNTQNNINNQGVGEMNIISSGTPIYIDGKLGKSLVFGEKYLIIPWNYSSEKITVSMWVKPLSPISWSDIFSFGDSDNRLEVNTSTGYYWFCNDSSISLIPSSTSLFSLNDSTWYHIAMTVDETQVKFYVNGVLSKAFTQSVTLSKAFGTNKNIYIGSRKNGGNRYTSNMSDIRVYDHCLSSREIKEISKGIVCHYTLSDIYATSSINKYSGETVNGKCSHNDFRCTKLDDEPGYKYTLNYTGNGSDTWMRIGFPTISYEVGKTYDYSCKARCNSANFTINMRASRCCNDWSTSAVTVSKADGEWHEYHTRQTMKGTTFLRSGTTDIQTTAPELEFYTSVLSENGKTYTADIDIKDVQISECNIDAPLSNGSWDDGVVYDSSGNGNHGNVKKDTSPIISNNSPRYDNCYNFNGEDSYFSIPNPLHSGSTDFSISCWVKFNNNNIQTIYTARTKVGDGIAVFFINYYIRLDDNNGDLVTFDYSMTKHINNWCHVCVVRNISNKKLYINGQLVSTINKVGDLQNIGKNGTIGGSEPSDNGIASSNYLNGSMSDFRLYATALSDNDVKELYETPILISDTGTLMTQGEYKEI